VSVAAVRLIRINPARWRIAHSANHHQPAEDSMTALPLRSPPARRSAQRAMHAPHDGWQALWMSAGVLILAAGELLFLWPQTSLTGLLMLLVLWAASAGAWQISTALRRRG
jgi:hypothetical protein